MIRPPTKAPSPVERTNRNVVSTTSSSSSTANKHHTPSISFKLSTRSKAPHKKRAIRRSYKSIV
ncbi:hypothetical protein GYMLUDRAFT_74669 [Collybiopsis luxurians FD-317 M1]|uniref:Uncharacterized protein n=1 Tax=Collybiopsis luxurians FD-317 M1 TaxID=944289 RepID=A0A0D0CKV9_9AGAR|nr:hypothetical protein GYMLUDRAFT_74669 [Collybiopsis luxurians FD-317 M1]